MKTTIKIYKTETVNIPYLEWLDTLDPYIEAKINSRISRIKKGNFGDCKSVGEGVYEFRLDFGPGYRIYYAKIKNTIILLLCGGTKRTQKRDIKKQESIGKIIKTGGRKMGKYDEDYDTLIIERLQKNTALIPEYIKAAFDDFDDFDDVETLLITLKLIAKAKKGGIAELSRKTGLNRQQLYRMFSGKGNPTLKTLHTVLKSLGYKLSIMPSAAT